MPSRRIFLTGLAGSALAAAIARAQQAPGPAAPAPAGAMKRVALASATVAAEAMIEGNAGDPGWNSFLTELKAQGFAAGQNVTFERYSGSQYNQVRRLQGNRWNALGTTIAGAKPDVIFSTSSFIARGANTAADTIPIVLIAGDVLATGLVSNLDKPGGSITGVTANSGAAREAMRVDLLREAAPSAMKIAYLVKSQALSPTPAGTALVASAQAAASKGGTFQAAFVDDVLDDAGLDATAHLRAVLDAKAAGAQGLVVADVYDITEYAAPLGGMALVAKLPAIAPWRDFVVGGGLMSYGPNQNDMFKAAAQQVARILKGEKPGDIAVARPQPELIVSQRNARNIGVTLPMPLVAKAKEVLM